MTPKLYKAAEVCEIAHLQPYVLRSWEKEFPGIGVQKAPGAPRFYRQSDVEQVLRIKQLVFGEGLTLSGARRRLEEEMAASPRREDSDVAEVLEALAADARTRVASVREGLRSLLKLLSSAPGTVVLVDDEYVLHPPPVETPAPRPTARRARSSRTSGARGSGKPSRQEKRPPTGARRAGV